MRHRRLLTLFAAGLAVVTLARQPTADIRLLTHDPADPAPQRFKAVIDLGIVGVSILHTWTTRRTT